jgi:hypothetical protein
MVYDWISTAHSKGKEIFVLCSLVPTEVSHGSISHRGAPPEANDNVVMSGVGEKSEAKSESEVLSRTAVMRAFVSFHFSFTFPRLIHSQHTDASLPDSNLFAAVEYRGDSTVANVCRVRLSIVSWSWTFYPDSHSTFGLGSLIYPCHR